MQDDRRRAEADRPAALLEAPADVDVVAGDPELLVEAADRLERIAPEGHVAAGDVLGDLVGEQDVRRATGCVGNSVLDEPSVVRDEVRTADPSVVARAEAAAP